MNRERMERLITILEDVERTNKAFNLGVWVAMEGDIDNRRTTGAYDQSCGTACCALGYAALDGQFQSQGLRLRAFANSDSDLDDTVERDLLTTAEFQDFWRNETLEDKEVRPVYRDEDGEWDAGELAGAAFFGITQDASEFLFIPLYYRHGYSRAIPPSEVIARVREVIALDGAAPADWDTRRMSITSDQES